MQQINEATENPVFFAGYFGALPHRRGGGDAAASRRTGFPVDHRCTRPLRRRPRSDDGRQRPSRLRARRCGRPGPDRRSGPAATIEDRGSPGNPARSSHPGARCLAWALGSTGARPLLIRGRKVPGRAASECSLTPSGPHRLASPPDGDDRQHPRAPDPRLAGEPDGRGRGRPRFGRAGACRGPLGRLDRRVRGGRAPRRRRCLGRQGRHQGGRPRERRARQGARGSATPPISRRSTGG